MPSKIHYVLKVSLLIYYLLRWNWKWIFVSNFNIGELKIKSMLFQKKENVFKLQYIQFSINMNAVQKMCILYS